MDTKGLDNCRCGGKPTAVTTKLGYGAIKCNKCGISTPDEDCDVINYGMKARLTWLMVMSERVVINSKIAAQCKQSKLCTEITL